MDARRSVSASLRAIGEALADACVFAMPAASSDARSGVHALVCPAVSTPRAIIRGHAAAVDSG